MTVRTQQTTSPELHTRRRRPWLVPALAAGAVLAVLATEPARTAVLTLIDHIHTGFLVVFVEAGSFVAGCF